MGPAELILILIVVLVIFGPDQLPEIAKKIGGATREIQRNLNAVSSEVNENLQPFKQLDDLAKLKPIEPPVEAHAPPSNLIVADENSVLAEQQKAALAAPDSSPT